ncbi:MAG: thioredoxin family protein [Thermoleophilia bacterium]
MRITLRYFDGCPNWRIAEERLRAALADAGSPAAAITLERVQSHEEAVRLAFRGSPTVLIDGRDPFADPRADVGLACRVYATPDGLQGAPTRDQLRAALGE